jgi:hypothetical protein
MITLNAENGDHRPGLAEESVFKKYRQSHDQSTTDSTAKMARQLQGQREMQISEHFVIVAALWSR